MKFKGLIGTSILAVVVATPAMGQDAQDNDLGYGEIVVTAQRQSERLQDVPIAVSAFSSEALESQQIENASDLQLSLPNVTFSKGNFTGSSFTIRGIGDLCVGVSCDSATAIHLDGTPLLQTRLFETEYFDLERIEVLRGPQGTLFGRNATSGVVNVVPKRPELGTFGGSAEFEYGNFDSIKAKGAINIPLGDKVAARVAGFYLKRDGYSKNLFDGSRVDGRDMYAVRGSLRFEPTETTTIDLSGYYFREKDDRLRIQKQMCQRDPTGVLGCLPNSRQYQVANGNSQFYGTLNSAQFYALNGIPTAFGLSSLYGPDSTTGAVNPANPRVVNADFQPQYFSSETQVQARLEQELGALNLQLTGFYHEAKVDSVTDYNLTALNPAVYTAGLSTLAAAAAGLLPGIPAAAQQAYFGPVARALIPNGVGGPYCTSMSEETGTGIYGGHANCASTPLDSDRSNQVSKDWSVEGIISSDFDGMFNFLLGGIYVDAKLDENSYYVNSFGADYLSGVLGAFSSLGAGLPPSFMGSPFFRNNTDYLRIKSHGVFGEGYFEFNDKLKLTLGLRYNNDKKFVRARSTLLSFLVPHGTSNIFDAPAAANFDGDPTLPGVQPFQLRRSKDSEFTGRAVIDYKISPDNMLYASYSRGYKSGGINPPLQPIFAVSDTFAPEFVNAFEIGSKNVFAGGKLVLNLTGFYYQYKGLQLSRIVARTAVNDNVDADIYGFEADAIIRPSREFAVNLGFSYLHTKVASDKFLGNSRDPSGGRDDAVIIKDITNASNCAVVPRTAGNTAATQAFVTAVNSAIGLQGPASFGPNSGLTATGAFGVCGILQAAAAGNIGAASAALAPLQALLNANFNGGVAGALPFAVENAGVPVNIRGNKLPQAPNFKFSVGAQYTAEFANGMSLVPRFDLTYTGESYGNIFNGPVNKVKGYAQANAQLQLNGVDDKWFARAFVQNIFNSSSVTGLYVGDQSQGLVTNIFTLEPRRYGIAIGAKF